MSISAAASFAQTIFSYFSPTKSPYYSVVAFSTFALLWSAEIINIWLLYFIPVALLLLYSTYLSLFDHPDFDEIEYDGQIKFARAFSLSASVLCMVATGICISFDEKMTSGPWYFWVSYVASVIQMLIFSFYAYVYANLKTKPIKKNFVQLALVTSTYLIGTTYAAIESAKHYEFDNHSYFNHDIVLLVTFSIFWLICIFVWIEHLKKSIIFSIVVPDDAKD